MNYVEEMKNIFIHWMDEYDENEILSMYNPWGPAGLFKYLNVLLVDYQYYTL